MKTNKLYGVGYGISDIYVDGKRSRCFQVWKEMLRRCYSESFHEKYPTYIGCEVCVEWHDFRVFREWYEENYYEIEGQRMDLDKDILVKGNKIYSPSTCVFVPQVINVLFTKRNSKRGQYPIGVSFDKKNNKYQANCHVRGKAKKLGRYRTVEQAFSVYKQAKEEEIKRIADEYIELIPSNLYQAMYNYEVSILD